MADTDGTTTKTNRAAFWQEHLRAWSQSGLTQADYCRQQQLSAAAFGWWKRQLHGKAKPRRRSSGAKRPQHRRPTAVQFVEVQRGPDVKTSADAATYEVLLYHGRAIRIGHDFDPAMLKRLIETVVACALRACLPQFLVARHGSHDLEKIVIENADVSRMPEFRLVG